MDWGTQPSVTKMIFCPKSQAEPRGGLHYSFSECFGPPRAAHTGGGHPATPLGSPAAVERQKEQLLPKPPTRLPIKWGGKKKWVPPGHAPALGVTLVPLLHPPRKAAGTSGSSKRFICGGWCKAAALPQGDGQNPPLPPSSPSKLQTLINNNKNFPYIKLIVP